MCLHTDSIELQVRERVARLYADYEAFLYCGQSESYGQTIRECLHNAIDHLDHFDHNSADNWRYLVAKADQTGGLTQ